MEQEKRLRLAELLVKGLNVDEVKELSDLIIEDRNERYELKQVKKLNIDDVNNQRELLIAFFNDLYGIETKEGKAATEVKVDCWLSNL